MRTIPSIIALAGLALAAFAAPAMAQTGPDYVFNVPVRIENTPPLAGQFAVVNCSVIAYNLVERRPTGTYYAQQQVTIGDSGYRDTVRIELTLPAGVRRSDVMNWSCSLILHRARTPAGAVVDMPAGADRAAAYTSVTGQTVASSQMLAQGYFFTPP
jgi:hypothetical protein